MALGKILIDLKTAVEETWIAVHEVQDEGRETGAVTYFINRGKARDYAQRRGLGGKHSCRMTDVIVLRVSPGHAFTLHPVTAEDHKAMLREHAKAKLTAEEFEELRKGG